MSFSLVFDITHLVSRRQVRPHTGIDRVDLAFGKALAVTDAAPVIGLHCGLAGPHLVPRQAIGSLVSKAESHSHALKDSEDLTKRQLRAWLAGSQQENAVSGETGALPSYSVEPRWGLRLQRQLCWLFANSRNVTIPPGAIYVNTAPYATPGPFYFRWLSSRLDVKAVFFLHDLLPIDYPEFFPAKWQPSFSQMISTVINRANGIIVASDVMRARVELELLRYGRTDVPVHVAHLPLPPAFLSKPTIDRDMLSYPYFVVSATIEPRKNHLLLLNLWRRLAEEPQGRCPHLVLIGNRGWENDQTTAMLDRCVNLRGRVLEAAGVSDLIQHWLLSNASGALFPSLAEGYGLPIVEALSLGLPTVASSIPVLKEISHGCAIFCDPLNTHEWRDAVLALSSRSSPTWKAAANAARRFVPPNPSNYFASILGFLKSL